MQLNFDFLKSNIPFFITTLTLAVFAAAVRVRRDTARNPPGPKGPPLIGNLLDFPQHENWVVFRHWKEQYGDIIFLNLLGAPFVILNSMNACNDLLDKRSGKYSGRPPAIVLGYAGFDFALPFIDYTPRWRKHRRLFHQHFNEHACLAYRPIQERSVHHFLQRLLTTPAKFFDHIRLLFGETILDVVYDIKVDNEENIFVQAAEKALQVAVQGATPGLFFVEFLPFMKYLPSWFPGGTFKRWAAEKKPIVMAAKDLAFDFVKNRLESGTAGPSVLSSMLSECGIDPETDNKDEELLEDAAKGCTAAAYLAGADTTLSIIEAFFMVMANYQDVQRAAQVEIVALLGPTPDHLPSYEDETQLPYIVAITKELLRWHTVTPLGVPHFSTEDDEYNGYFIPKGTLMVPNIWGILHDPELYPEPFKFNPSRWLIDTPSGPQLNPDIPDPRAAFGFGRRICPGRHFALNSLFITVASVLACFDIRPLDAQGKPVDHVDEIFREELIRYPLPFKASITPRSTHMAQLINDIMV